MEHITEIQLIEYVAGNLGGEAAREVDVHVEQCSKCSKACGEIRQTWEAANLWQVDIDASEGAQEFADKVIALNSKERSLSIRSKIVQVSWRYAASILIAVSLGAMLGNKSGAEDSEIHFGQNNPEYLAALSMQWSSDLTWTILEHDQPEQEVAE